jgi:amino acid transporter
MILASASIQSGGTYVPQNYQVFLLTTCLMVIHGFMSSMPTAHIARFNAGGSTFNMIALLIVIIIIPISTNRREQGLPHFNSSADVWGEYRQVPEISYEMLTILKALYIKGPTSPLASAC